jgi:hypothetical protein
MTSNSDALRVGKMAERLADSFYVLSAALSIAIVPGSHQLAPSVLPGNVVPVGTLLRKDGTEHVFHFTHYLEKARSDPDLLENFQQAWLGGALITLGDALTIHSYFTHDPILELVYHLRNGIAHGNTFHFTEGGLRRLQEIPAHNRGASVAGNNRQIFEITPELDGNRVLFDFMGPANVQDLLMSVDMLLTEIGNGTTFRLQ